MNAKIKKTGTIHDTLTGYDFTVDDKLTPLRSMRAKCLECSNRSPTDVLACEIVDCTLWPYRSGKRTGTSAASEETKKASSDRMKKMHKEGKFKKTKKK